MHARPVLTLLAALGLVAGVGACGAPERTLADRLVGFWEPVVEGGQPSMPVLDLRADGTFTRANVAILEFRWKLDGDLLQRKERKDDAQENAVRLVFEGDTMVQRRADGKEMRRLVRVGAADPASPLLGVWRGTKQEGPPSWERYLPNGTGSWRGVLGQGVHEGGWRLEGDELRVHPPGEPDGGTLLEIAFEGETLVFGGERGPRVPHERVAGGPWYPLLPEDR